MADFTWQDLILNENNYNAWAAAPWLPILVIHFRSQVKTWETQSYKFKKNAKNFDFDILQEVFLRDTPSEVAR